MFLVNKSFIGRKDLLNVRLQQNVTLVVLTDFSPSNFYRDVANRMTILT